MRPVSVIELEPRKVDWIHISVSFALLSRLVISTIMPTIETRLSKMDLEALASTT